MHCPYFATWDIETMLEKTNEANGESTALTHEHIPQSVSNVPKFAKIHQISQRQAGNPQSFVKQLLHDMQEPAVHTILQTYKPLYRKMTTVDVERFEQWAEELPVVGTNSSSYNIPA